MKQLQNDFTTPEQSKRLLELGVPADSADCYYEAIGFNQGYKQTPQICTNGKFGINIIDLPCWSTGRLIEIIIACGIGVGVPDELFINKYSLTPSLITNLIRRLERAAASGVNNINFSKLED